MGKKFVVRRSNLTFQQKFDLFDKKIEEHSALALKGTIEERIKNETLEFYYHGRKQKLLGKEPYRKASNKLLYKASQNIVLKKYAS
jgi:hypothetical protein